jgi:hypothetical protein
MAEETVVKEMLTQERVQAGAELTRRLDEAHLEVCASFWLYMPDKNLWRLIVASPAVRQDGPKKVYQQIQTILSKMSDQTWKIPLHDISVVEDSDPLIVSLHTSLGTKDIGTKDGMAGRRFSRDTVNGHFIEDAYIYKMA